MKAPKLVEDKSLANYVKQVEAFDHTLRKSHTTTKEQYQFLEGCMIENAIKASSIFHDKHEEMTPMEAAKAASLFADRAVSIRKAHEADFKEPPVNVGIILKLQTTLNALSIQEKTVA